MCHVLLLPSCDAMPGLCQDKAQQHSRRHNVPCRVMSCQWSRCPMQCIDKCIDHTRINDYNGVFASQQRVFPCWTQPLSWTECVLVFIASWPRRTDGLRKGLFRKSSFAEVHDQSQRRGLRTSHLVSPGEHHVSTLPGSAFAQSQRAMVSCGRASHATGHSYRLV